VARDLIAKLKALPHFEPRTYYRQHFASVDDNKSSLSACCPFHEDHNPSFSVDLSTGKWVCWAGCGNGDQLDFQARIEGKQLDKPFIADLAKRFLPQEPKQRSRKGGKSAGRAVGPENFNISKFAKQKGLTVDALQTIHATEVDKGSDLEICFPMVNVTGKQVGYRRRLADGSVRTNKGGRLGLFIPKTFDKTKKLVHICEGETDTAAAVMVGLTNPIGTPGTGKCIADITTIVKAMKAKAVVFPDNDKPGKAGGMRLAYTLAAEGVKVKVCEVPGNDLREAITAKKLTLEALQKLIDGTKYLSNTSKYIPECLKYNADKQEPPADAIARDYLQMNCRNGKTPLALLRHWRGEYFKHKGNAWEPIPIDDLKSKLWRFASPFYIRSGPTRQKVTNILEGLSGEIHLSDNLNMPLWLDDNQGHKASEIDPVRYISMTNGLLDTSKYVLTEHAPYYFCRNAIPINFDMGADCPEWLRFLSETFEDDDDRIRVLQEFFGYSLVPDNRHQKFMLMQGAGANGKSQIIDVLSLMVGAHNVSAVPLDQFGDRFGMYPIIGKLVNVCGDVAELDKVAEGYLKIFTSGDLLTIDRKHLAPVTMRATTKLVMACNNPPRFRDRSYGLWRRMIMLPFNYVVPEGKRIQALGRKIFRKEAAGIFNWSLQGMERLNARGGFSLSKAVTEAHSDYQLECNPTMAFLQDYIVVCAEGKIDVDRLYRAYQRWCKLNGYRPLNATHFGREVFTVYPAARKEKKTTPTGRREVSYVGITTTGNLDMGE